MRAVFITIVIFVLLIANGCTSVVTSVKPVSLYNAKSNYLVLDGIPYFLPKSVIHIDITWNKDDKSWKVDLTPKIQPDHNYRFLLKQKSNALFDDNITFTVDENSHLLQAVKTTITDKSVSSIADLVGAAGSALKFGAAAFPLRILKAMKEEGAPPTELKPLPRYVFHGDFDPDFDPKGGFEIPPLTSPDGQFEAKFTIKSERLGTPITSVKSPGESIDRIVETDSGNEVINGIVVRLPIPYQIEITHVLSEISKEHTPIETTQSTIILLPDVKQNYVFPIYRRCLVTDETNVTLKNGMITIIEQKRPSMVAGVVGIPKTILGALVPIPTEVRSTQNQNLTLIQSTAKSKADIQKSQSE